MYCTYCGTQNHENNYRCTSCHRIIQFQDKTVMDAPPAADPMKKFIVPVNVSKIAMAAGYLGLLSIFLVPAPVALLVGCIALYDLERNPGKNGKGRAVFGIIMGALFSILLGFMMMWFMQDASQALM